MERKTEPVGAPDAAVDFRTTLAIGCFAAVCRDRLGDRLLAFARAYPALDVGVQEMGRSDLLAAVRDRSLDIAVLPGGPRPGLCSAAVWNERVMLAVPPDHRFARQPAVAPGDLRHERLLVPRQPPGRELHRFLMQQVAPLLQIETVLCEGGLQRQMDQVAAGVGLALSCASHGRVGHGRAVLRPIAASTADFAVSAYWADPTPAPILSALIEILRDAAGDR